jgi:hypothetical protein
MHRQQEASVTTLIDDKLRRCPSSPHTAIAGSTNIDFSSNLLL